MTAVKTRTSKSAEISIELQKKLLQRLIMIVVLVILVILAATVFSPKVGFLFGLISINRNNETDNKAIKPSTPILTAVPEAVNDEKISLTGYGQPGLNVKLFVNGPEVASQVIGSDGVFNFNDVALNSGRNTIFAKIINGQGQESDKSQTYIINVDKQKPEIDVESPKDGSTVQNLDKRIKIFGKVNEKATVTVNGRTAVVRPDLTFEFLLGVEVGEIEIKLEATDIAGNTKQEEINVFYKRDN